MPVPAVKYKSCLHVGLPGSQSGALTCLQEPYRFLAISGSESLIQEAGSRLTECAAECVTPLRKALETREPTAVAVALGAMHV
jgi:hypothetical protein